ncbi:MAG: hypothetical protein J6U75_03260 [Clostridia bacterium]|nr:hypothetical protein [Clostridia bacterium]MBP5238456.1 hypothetical protein [Clostridia bacterium]
MKALIKKLIDFLKARPYCLILVIWPAQIIWYGVLNHLIVQDPAKSHLIHIPFDDKIPYIRQFSLFYILWFAFIAACLIYVLIYSKKDFLRCAVGCMFTLYVCMTFCTIFPTYHDLRVADTGGGLTGLIVKMIYAADEPTVIYPSMHVMVSYVLAIRMTFAESMKGKVWWKLFIWFFATMITLSTMFIKQHSSADVFLALALVIPFDLIVRFLILPDRRFKEKDAPAKAKERDAVST